MHALPIQQRIDWLFDLARRHAAEFSSPESFLARKRYLAEHPAAMLVLKCMDGRINIPIATNTPTGIIQPFRNRGGMFNLGWPHLGETLVDAVGKVVAQGRRVLVMITYHYSRGDPKRGCAGFNYDTEAARRHTEGIKAEVEAIFGRGHGTVYPLVCGFETDEDALVLHGDHSAALDMAAATTCRSALPPCCRTCPSGCAPTSCPRSTATSTTSPRCAPRRAPSTSSTANG